MLIAEPVALEGGLANVEPAAIEFDDEVLVEIHHIDPAWLSIDPRHRHLQCAERKMTLVEERQKSPLEF